jgi:hypothetical protein
MPTDLDHARRRWERICGELRALEQRYSELPSGLRPAKRRSAMSPACARPLHRVACWLWSGAITLTSPAKRPGREGCLSLRTA